MPTPLMQRQRRHQCSAGAIVAATVASSSTRPRHGGTDLAPSRCHRRHDALSPRRRLHRQPSARRHHRTGTLVCEPRRGGEEARLLPSCSVGPVMVPSLSAGQMMPTVPPLLCWNNIFGDILFAVGICVVNGLGYFAIDILLVGEGGSVHLRRPPNPKHICKTVLTPPVRRHGFSSRNVCTASIVFGGKLGG